MGRRRPAHPYPTSPPMLWRSGQQGDPIVNIGQARPGTCGAARTRSAGTRHAPLGWPAPSFRRSTTHWKARTSARAGPAGWRSATFTIGCRGPRPCSCSRSLGSASPGGVLALSRLLGGSAFVTWSKIQLSLVESNSWFTVRVCLTTAFAGLGPAPARVGRVAGRASRGHRPGLWLKDPPQGLGGPRVSSLTRSPSVALCARLVDGQKGRLEHDFWLQRFTRAGPQQWSRINTERPRP